jgi:hypothetical protein
MSDEKKNQQPDLDKLREQLKESINREHRGDQASYQPEKSELDDNNPPGEDSE